MPARALPLTPPALPLESGRKPLIDVTESSMWFRTAGHGALVSAEESTEMFSGGEEFWLWPTEGSGEVLLPSGAARTLRPFDGVYMPSGTSLTLVNRGTEPFAWLELGCGSRADALAPVVAPPSEPVVFDRRAIGPRQWPANEVGASAKPYWFYTVDEFSSWFHSACISCLPPGGATALHSHLQETEGFYETWYFTLRGEALLRTEFEDVAFERSPAGAFVPIGASHQLINNGEDFLWFLTISSRGPHPLVVDVYGVPAGTARPGYAEEYQRIIGERRKRGLPVP